MRLTAKHCANLLIGLAICWGMVGGGCGHSSAALTAMDTNPRRAMARWDDLPAAVAAAADHNGMAVVEELTGNDAQGASFELLTLYDERGVLKAAWSGEEIELRAELHSVSPSAADRARGLVRDVFVRLEQLRARGYAPLPRDW